MAGHVVKHAIARASIDPAEVDDVVMGCGLPEGATGNNIGRTAALRAGCPVSVPGETVSRFCASGLDAIAIAAKRVIADGAKVIDRGGRRVDQHGAERRARPFPHRRVVVAARARSLHADAFHGRFRREEIQVSRERQDEYALQSQQRTAAAQAAGRFDAEIVALPSWKYEQNRENGAVTERQVELAKDEGNRPDTTLEGLSCAQRRRSGRRRHDHHRRKLVPAFGRCCGGRDRRRGTRAKPKSHAAGDLPRLCRRGMRAR